MKTREKHENEHIIVVDQWVIASGVKFLSSYTSNNVMKSTTDCIGKTRILR